MGDEDHETCTDPSCVECRNREHAETLRFSRRSARIKRIIEKIKRLAGRKPRA